MPFDVNARISQWNHFEEGPLQRVETDQGCPDYYIKRLDLIQSWASGNKYYKLKYVLQEAIASGVNTIISKGGMFSNHLAALSDACRTFHMKLIAIVRSYAPDEDNPSIQHLRSNGDQIIFVSPKEYKNFGEIQARDNSRAALFIPEGGLSALGIRGSSEIVREFSHIKPTHIVLAGGTMSTACGIFSGMEPTCKLMVMPAWKGCNPDYFSKVLEAYNIPETKPWALWPDFHFGGFGKFDQGLIDFMGGYKAKYNIPLDPVYTGKLLYAVHHQLTAGYFKTEDNIVVIHSGGLQGVAGYKYRFPESWGGY